MKKFKFYLTRSLVAIFLLLFMGCDETGMVAVDVGESPDFKMECFMDQGAMQFEASGAIEDAGIVEGTPVPRNAQEDGFINIYRKFTGKKGQFSMLVEATLKPGQKRIAEGTFHIMDGSEAYAGLDAEGVFRAEIGKDGALIEFFDG